MPKKSLSTFASSRHVLQPRQVRSREALIRILQAAEQLLREKGLDGFSMNEVAKKSGLPVGNIYRRFKGKAELLLAIKEDVTSKIENAVVERISDKKFSDISSLMLGFVEALIDAFAHDESVHLILFDRRVRDAELDQVGFTGRQHIFAYYRNALLPLMPEINRRNAETLVRVSFHIVAAAVVGKADGYDQTISRMSWKSLGTEFAQAALCYLHSNIAVLKRNSAKPRSAPRIVLKR